MSNLFLYLYVKNVLFFIPSSFKRVPLLYYNYCLMTLDNIHRIKFTKLVLHFSLFSKSRLWYYLILEKGQNKWKE